MDGRHGSDWRPDGSGLLKWFEGVEIEPQGLKPMSLLGVSGTAEAVPFQN